MRSAVESATMTITVNRELRAIVTMFASLRVKIEKNLVRNAALGFAVWCPTAHTAGYPDMNF